MTRALTTTKPARVMNRARVYRVVVTAAITKVAATMVAAVMTNREEDRARPHSNKQRDSDNDNTKDNREDEGHKGNDNGSYGATRVMVMMSTVTKTSLHSTTIN